MFQPVTELMRDNMSMNVVSISGGKDSLATMLYAIEQEIKFIAAFADTGNEHQYTYEYIDYLEQKTGVPIQRVKADFSRNFEVRRKNIQAKWEAQGIPQARIDRAIELLQPTGNPFLDLCMLKGRFPSTRARFCSQELKHIPIHNRIFKPLLDVYDDVFSWQGVRAEESESRAKLVTLEEVNEHPGLWNFRPIHKLTAADVFAIAARHGIEPNPLYKNGMGRVGCMPCIHARKMEIREIAARFPAEIERIAEWENLVKDCSKRGAATFFAQDKTPGGNERGPLIAPGIHEVVEWSKTTRGGKIYDVFWVEQDVKQCSSIYGLCE